MQLARTFAFVGLGVFSTCCTRELPPPAVPARVVPTLAVSPPPPEADRGRVGIDVTEGRAKVFILKEKAEGTGYGPTSLFVNVDDMIPVCATPCVANLPYGNHTLLFRDIDDHDNGEAHIAIGESPSVVRVTMGNQDPGNPVLLTIGQMMVTIGATEALIGGGLLGTDQDDATKVGAVLLGTGVVLAAAGLYLAFEHRATTQESTYLQWQPKDDRVFTKTE